MIDKTEITRRAVNDYLESLPDSEGKDILLAELVHLTRIELAARGVLERHSETTGQFVELVNSVANYDGLPDWEPVNRRR